MNKSFQPKKGEMVLYNYLNSDLLRGKVIELLGKKAKIEIGVCHRKSEDIWTDILEVNLTDLLPFNYVSKN